MEPPSKFDSHELNLCKSIDEVQAWWLHMFEGEKDMILCNLFIYITKLLAWSQLVEEPKNYPCEESNKVVKLKNINFIWESPKSQAIESLWIPIKYMSVLSRRMWNLNYLNNKCLKNLKIQEHPLRSLDWKVNYLVDKCQMWIILEKQKSIKEKVKLSIIFKGVACVHANDVQYWNFSLIMYCPFFSIISSQTLCPTLESRYCD